MSSATHATPSHASIFQARWGSCVGAAEMAGVTLVGGVGRGATRGEGGMEEGRAQGLRANFNAVEHRHWHSAHTRASWS